MKLERPVVKLTFKTFLLNVLLWPGFVNKFLIAYGNLLTFEHAEFKYYDGK